MDLFKGKLQDFDWDMKTSTPTDFAALVAVPPTKLMQKFWSRVSELEIGTPKQDDLIQSCFEDEERKDTAKVQLERLLKAAETALDKK